MPASLRRYLLSMCTTAAVIAAVVLPDLRFIHIPLLETLTFLLLAAAADMAPSGYRNIEALATDAILMAAALLLPPSVLALVVICATLPSELLQRKGWDRIAFNVSYRLILFEVLAAFGAHWSGLPTMAHPADPLLLLAVSTTIYMTITTVSIAGVVALMQGTQLLETWRNEWRAFSLFDLSLVPYGIMLAWLWQLSISAFAIGLLPLVIVQRAFSIQVRLLEEKAATQRLVKQQRELQDATTSLLATLEAGQQIAALMAHLRRIFDLQSARVILWSQEGQLEHFDDEEGESRDSEPLLPILRDAVESGRIRRLDPAATPAVDRYGVVLPMATAAGPLGCLLLLSEGPLLLTADEEGVLATFAGHAALAIYQARLVEKVKESHQQVLQTSRLASVGTLAAGVAHEFNNLLAVISGTAEIAEGAPADEQERALRTIVEAARRGSSITRGLLTFARRMTPRRQLAAVTDAIEPVLALMEHEFVREQVKIERRYEPVPPTVYDLGMLSQVILNLLTNSRDALRPHGGTVVITVDQQGPAIRIAVSDNGSGIPEQLIERIFDPFMTTKMPSSGSGTGLGLSISYGIVTDHGGKITAESVEGHGTTMTVFLPIVEPTDTNAAPARLAGMRVARRVVVVDDEPLIGRAIHQFLTQEGYSCRVFTSPEEALASVRTMPADFVIADFSMPGMDGVTFIERVSALQGPTASLLITGEVEERHVQRARAAGVERILEKPFRMQELKSALGDIHPAMKQRIESANQEPVAAGQASGSVT